jgi:hypothetical protein
MSNKAYIGSSKRTFDQAFIHEMETNYGFLNSKRMLRLLADDVQRLVDQFYPPVERLRPGWMVFTGTKATGIKAFPGQPTEALEMVTLAWPLLITEDLDWMTTQPDILLKRRELMQRRIIRILDYGWEHPQGPVLLTLADLALMLGSTTEEVSQLLKKAREETGKPLLTKGYFFDQGMRPTHKVEIVTLYEQGMDEADIARTSKHSPTSVGRYLRDYARVKELVKNDFSLQKICRLLDMRPSVVKAYLELLRNFHPELLPNADSTHTSS